MSIRHPPTQGGHIRSQTNDGASHLTESFQTFQVSPDIFSFLTPAERKHILEQAKRKYYEEGEFVFQQGDSHDGIYIILQGKVRSFYISPGGQEITLAYMPKGHFVGAPQVFSGGDHMWTSQAVTSCQCLWINAAQLLSWVRETPNLAVGLIEGLAYKGQLYATRLQVMATRSKIARLAHLLLTLAELENNNKQPVKPRIAKLTHAELASMVGSTRQSVSQGLERLESEGLIIRESTGILLTDIPALKAKCH